MYQALQVQQAILTITIEFGWGAKEAHLVEVYYLSMGQLCFHKIHQLGLPQ